MAGREDYEFAKVEKEYTQNSGKERIKQFFFDNLNKIVTNEQLQEVASMNYEGRYENWHQRLSELRTDEGYTILSRRDREWLNQGEYLMPHKKKKETASKRIYISDEAWAKVLERANHACEWEGCGLREGDTDPIGGGTVQLQPDHMTPHDSVSEIDADDPDQWQALCGRHQVMKKNFWDDETGKLNYYAIVQSAPASEKRKIYKMLKKYFGDE